jgi:hypothetical protein
MILVAWERYAWIEERKKRPFKEGLDLMKDRPESLERASILFELDHCVFSLGNNKEVIACF